MAKFKINYNNKFIVDKEATGNVPVVYNGKVIGDIVEGRNRTLSCANTKAGSRILIGDNILDCKDKLMNTDIFVAYFDDSQGGEFPEEASTYELINTYTTSTTFTAPEYGWYQIEIFGASGNGGASVGASSGGLLFYYATGAGGGGGGYSCSRIKMNKGDTIALTVGTVGATTSATINSSLESYSSLQVISGGNGTDGNRGNYGISWVAGTSGAGGTASGGNYSNTNGAAGIDGIKVSGGFMPSGGDFAAGGAGANGAPSGGASAKVDVSPSDNTRIQIGTAGKGSAGFIKIYRGNTNVEELAPPVSDILEENDWATISEIAQKGEAANYWSIGDTKAVVLNGKVGNITLSNVTYYAYILGINHNQSIEGNGIHFSFRESSGKDIMFYPLAMNTSNTNSGGWASCTMRNTYCTALFNCLSDDLKAAISDCIKYSDNTGGTSQLASYVTATNDKIFIPAEFELFGTRTGANPAEQNYQKQYDYYAAGNPKKRYHHANNTVYLDYWLRSSDATNTASFRINRSTGVSDYGGVTAGIGCAACFKV